jgi:hypothetical protein
MIHAERRAERADHRSDPGIPAGKLVLCYWQPAALVDELRLEAAVNRAIDTS